MATQIIKPTGIGPEYDTRIQGSLFNLGGLRNAVREETKIKKFKSFRESMDSPTTDMGIGGSSNKDEMETPSTKFGQSGTTIKKIIKKFNKGENDAK